MPRPRKHNGFQKGNTIRKETYQQQQAKEEVLMQHEKPSPDPPLLRPRQSNQITRPLTSVSGIQRHVLQDGYFVGLVSSVPEFLRKVNENARCATKSCRGQFVCVDQKQTGLGGGLVVKVACSSCFRHFPFYSSPTHEGRNLAGFACMVASFLAGGTYAEYARSFSYLFGDFVFSHETFRKMVLSLHAPIEAQLKWEIEIGRGHMKSKPHSELGSWWKAVTTSDGCYHVRGHFSLNMTLTVVDYLSGFVISYLHQCSKGRQPSPDSEENWKGTAKAAEAFGTGTVFEELKEAGMNLAVNVQDRDSSSVNRVKAAFPQATIITCFGHHNRAFGKALEKIAIMKGPECNQVSGSCISKGFIIRAKTNHIAIAKEANGNPLVYKRKMEEVGKYHARGIHEWEDGGHCSHPVVGFSPSQVRRRPSKNAHFGMKFGTLMQWTMLNLMVPLVGPFPWQPENI